MILRHFKVSYPIPLYHLRLTKSTLTVETVNKRSAGGTRNCVSETKDLVLACFLLCSQIYCTIQNIPYTLFLRRLLLQDMLTLVAPLQSHLPNPHLAHHPITIRPPRMRCAWPFLTRTPTTAKNTTAGSSFPGVLPQSSLLCLGLINRQRRFLIKRVVSAPSLA